MPPLVRIACCMKNGVDSHSVVRILIEDCIREPAGQSSVVLFVNGRVHLRHAADRGDTGFNATQQFLSKADSARFVSCGCLSKILDDFRRNDQLSGHGVPEPCI